MTKRSAKIWLASLFSFLCLLNHSNMICAHPELIRANAETVKSLLLIVMLHAWLSNINTDTWLVLDNTRPAPITGNSGFRKGQRIKEKTKRHNLHDRLHLHICKLKSEKHANYDASYLRYICPHSSVHAKWCLRKADRDLLLCEVQFFHSEPDLICWRRRGIINGSVVLPCWHLCIWKRQICIIIASWEQLLYQITSCHTT